MHSIARAQKILTFMSQTGECQQQDHTQHPQRKSVSTSMVGLKIVTYPKILPKMVNPGYIAGERRRRKRRTRLIPVLFQEQNRGTPEKMGLNAIQHLGMVKWIWNLHLHHIIAYNTNHYQNYSSSAASVFMALSGIVIYFLRSANQIFHYQRIIIINAKQMNLSIKLLATLLLLLNIQY